MSSCCHPLSLFANRRVDAVVEIAMQDYHETEGADSLRRVDNVGELEPDYAYPFKSVNNRFEDQVARRQLGQETACCDADRPLGPGQYEYLTPRQWVHQQPQNFVRAW